ncbi:MAG TPA: hypothetical protein PLU88_08150 [Armatimonadota bacterium]|jgi:hypothetical protein|nr:hypothetical protein [Armatimonadota bacterium]HOM71512.1 hypothetical protein [Armatimonadota bacterium]HPP75078.1 hypothetical protein [Armatimonadota bacterium]
MQMPYGSIDGNILTMQFSSADFSVASVITAIRAHLDVMEELGVKFLGIATEITSGPTPVFRPTNIEAKFEYSGDGKCLSCLERTYQIIWKGVIDTFPSEAEWAKSKSDFAQYIAAQAELLRARTEATKE